jgi:sodium/hydrogen antiporter
MELRLLAGIDAQPARPHRRESCATRRQLATAATGGPLRLNTRDAQIVHCGALVCRSLWSRALRARLSRSDGGACEAARVNSSALVVVSAVFLGYAAISRRLHETSLTAPIVFVGAGLLFGPHALGWLDVTLNEHGVSVLAEATLAVVLFTDASRIDLRALRREYSVPARLLGIGLPLTIAAGSIAGAFMFSDVTWAEAVVLAIVLAPTDAALGQSVVTEDALPSRIRQGLNIESGLNDGLCVPLLTIAIALAETEAHATTAADAVRLVVEAIGWGIVGGVVAGGLAAYVLRSARAHGWMEGHWAQVVPVVGAAGSFGIADVSGGSGFIAAFVGGVVFGIVASQSSSPAFAEELGGVLNGLTLIVFGAAVLGALWSDIGATDLAYAVVSLTVVRMIPVAIAMLGSPSAVPDRPVRGLVRTAWAGLNRVRRRCGRGLRAAAHIGARRRADHDHRLECRRSRRHGCTSGTPLRRLA